MQTRTKTGNTNIDKGNEIFLYCNSKRKVKIIPIYINHKTKEERKICYKFELYDTIDGKIECIHSNIPYNVERDEEIDKLYKFFQETAILADKKAGTSVITTNKANLKRILSTLKSNDLAEILSSVTLDELNIVVSIRNLEDIISELKENLNGDFGEKEYWQPFFKKYTWILSQLFVAPYIFFRDEFYVGGKIYNQKGSISSDYGYKNPLTKNCSLIEIKTPQTKLIDQYRNDTEFCISKDLSGAVSQLLKQRDLFQKHYLTNSINNTNDEVEFKGNNIKSILIVGKVPDDNRKKETFENFRNELRNLEIITFDEILYKLEFQLEILKSNFK